MAKGKLDESRIVDNKKARFRYEVLETLVCGIALKGTEVKSLRKKEVSLDQAYARIMADELWLLGCNISPYSQGNVQNHDPVRPRKLLAHRREVKKWLSRVKTKGLTLVPLNMFFNERSLAKVTIGLVRGKTHGDKRESLKKKSTQREMDRALRGRGKG